jgi:hypothetical protein
MINPAIALGAMKLTQMTMLLVRLRKVAEAKCLSGKESTKLSEAEEQLGLAVLDSSELGSAPIVIGEGVPPVNREQMVSELQEIAQDLNELAANERVPEAPRKGLTRSLNTIQRLLQEI